MNNAKPIASLSLDLDNKWSYMKTHGDAGWESFPSYLDIVVPRMLKLLGDHNLTITFFIVGQDAALAANHDALRALADAGHEIGNHSFHHDPWLHLYSEPELEQEIALAEEHIERVTGQAPKGFRGPGFSVSQNTLNVLSRRGYLYDASTFPTFLGPLARLYYLTSTRLTPEQERQRALLFGAFSEGFRPLYPYQWRMNGHPLIEIPVTTMPLFRLPIHVSYVLYLARFSPFLARLYFRTTVSLCRLTNTQLSLLLHPLDVLGCDDDRDLAFFPAMNIPSARKLALVDEMLDQLSGAFRVTTMRQHALEAAQCGGLRLVTPKFPHAALPKEFDERESRVSDSERPARAR